MTLPDPVISSSATRVSGELCFSGTRVPVRLLFDCLASGHQLNEFLIQFPDVSREHAIAVLAVARQALESQAEATTLDAPAHDRHAIPVQYGHATATAVSAAGVAGVLCSNATDGSTFFRVYDEDGDFRDYDLRHDELPVTITADAMASFYHLGEDRLLDHSPEVLGLQPHAGSRASGDALQTPR